MDFKPAIPIPHQLTLNIQPSATFGMRMNSSIHVIEDFQTQLICAGDGRKGPSRRPDLGNMQIDCADEIAGMPGAVNLAADMHVKSVILPSLNAILFEQRSCEEPCDFCEQSDRCRDVVKVADSGIGIFDFRNLATPNPAA